MLSRNSRRKFLIGTLAWLTLLGMSCIKSQIITSELNIQPTPLPPQEQRISEPRKDSLEELATEQTHSQFTRQESYKTESEEEIEIKDDIDQYVANAIQKIQPKGIVNHAYIRAVIRAESRENPRATSSAGAMGYMQLIPETWKKLTRELYGKSLSKKSAYSDPQENIIIGTYYLRKILDGFAEKYGEQFTSLSDSQQRAVVSCAYLSGPGEYHLGDLEKKERHWHAQKVERTMWEFILERGL